MAITANEFYKGIFGQKTYKLSIDSGCTCPNRDGSKGFGGCTFCSETGSGDFTASRDLPISKQIEFAKSLVAKKIGSKNKNPKYIAYFQNFSNTYGCPEVLIKKYNEAINEKDVVGIAIATRPDCLNTEILQGIKDLSNKCFVQIEFGLQTSNQHTVDIINRCYHNEEYQDAVKKIHSINNKIHIVTHIIFGLPAETEVDMMNTVKYAIDSKTDGIKITNLYIVKNTALEEDYERKSIIPLEKDEYFSLLKKAQILIPDNIVIHRLTGDPPKKNLIAPTWPFDKKKKLNKMKKLALIK